MKYSTSNGSEVIRQTAKKAYTKCAHSIRAHISTLAEINMRKGHSSSRLVYHQHFRPVFGRFSVRNSAGTHAILPEIFGSFLESPQVNVHIVPGLGHDHFFPNPLQFIFRPSSYFSTLYSLKYWQRGKTNKGKHNKFRFTAYWRNGRRKIRRTIIVKRSVYG
jgi:hypothetical protein